MKILLELLKEKQKNLICNCASIEFYDLKNFEKSCQRCKKKYNLYYGTLFHGLKFGIEKALGILILDVESNFSSNISEIANKFEVSRKTANKFLEKIRNRRKESIEIFNKVSSKDIDKENVLKLLKFSNKNKP